MTLPDRRRRFLATQAFAASIIDVVATHFGVPIDRIRGRRRHRLVSRTRAVAAYVLRHATSLSWPEIGAALGGFSHSSMIYAVRKVKAAVAEDALLKIDLLQVAEQLLQLRRPRELNAPVMKLLPSTA